MTRSVFVQVKLVSLEGGPQVRMVVRLTSLVFLVIEEVIDFPWCHLLTRFIKEFHVVEVQTVVDVVLGSFL